MRTLKYIIGISLAVGLVACDDFLVEQLLKKKVYTIRWGRQMLFCRVRTQH